MIELILVFYTGSMNLHQYSVNVSIMLDSDFDVEKKQLLVIGVISKTDIVQLDIIRESVSHSVVNVYNNNKLSLSAIEELFEGNSH